MHTEATCMLPTAIREDGGGIPHRKGSHIRQGNGCDITSESFSLMVLLQSLQMVLGHTQA